MEGGMNRRTLVKGMHGLRAWQLDPGAIVIRALERVGLAWDVVRVPPTEQRELASPR